MGDGWSPQPRESPGEPGSCIPGLEAFRDPSTVPGMGGIFRNIRFDYNSNFIRGNENLTTMRNASNYLKSNSKAYIFVEGHCDERGPAAYNLALGSRRSNAVRNMLLSDGVNPNQVYTISYGNERPLIMDHNEEAWAQNRRAEFKIYVR